MIEMRQLAALAGLLLGGAWVVTPAYASTDAISCTGWTRATYMPGLTNTVKSTAVVVDGDLNIIDAHSPTGSCLAVGTRATAGQRNVTAQLDVSCTQFLVETGVETINWNDGQSTSFAFSANVTRGASNTVIVESGTVTAGEFAGGHVVETFTAPNTAFTDCGTPGGVTALDFLTVITITP